MLEKGRNDAKDPDATPFVVGVVGDFSGIPAKTPLKQARFLQLDVRSFAGWLSRISAATTPAVEPGSGEPPDSRAASLAGLEFLLHAVAPFENVAIRILDCTKQRIFRDLQRAPEFDQSQVFKKVYEQEYGTFGGRPFGCLLFDYWISQNVEDLELVEKLAQVAASAMTPMLIGIAPGFFPVGEWQDLNPELSVEWMTGAASNRNWASLRASEDMQWCFGLMPRLVEPAGIHPGFLIAFLAARAFLDLDLRAIGSRLFDESASAISGLPAPVYEWSFPESFSGRLLRAGLNCLGPHTRLGSVLRDAVPMAKPGADGSVPSLAEALLVSQLHSRLHSYVRRKRTSDSLECFDDSVDQWVRELMHSDGPPLPDPVLEFVSRERSNHGCRIDFRLRPEVAPRGISRTLALGMSMPYLQGRVEDTPRAASPVALRLVLLTPPLAPRGVWWRARTITSADDFFPALKKPSIQLTLSGFEPARSIEASLQLESPASLDAADIIERIPRLHELAENRKMLLNIATYSEVSKVRNAAVAVLGSRPGAMDAIRPKVEAWKSALSAGPDSPVPPEEVNRSLPCSQVSDWDVDWDFGAAVAVYDAWAKPVSHPAAGSGWAQIQHAIDAIDALSARYLTAIYSDPLLHRIECIEESVRSLLRAVGPIDVLPLEHRSLDELTTALDYESPYRERQPGFQSNLLMLEIRETPPSGLDALMALLELNRLERTVVLAGIEDQAGVEVFRELARAPSATSLAICVGRKRVPRTRSVTISGRSLMLPELASTGIFALAEVLAKNQEQVFLHGGNCLEAATPYFAALGWQPSKLGNALVLRMC